MRRWPLVAAMLLLSVAEMPGCAPTSKPASLARLEALHQQVRYRTARREDPELARRSREARRASEKAWDAGRIQEAAEWAEIGVLRGRVLLTATAENRAREDLARLQRHLAELTARHVQVLGQIDQVDEKIMLYEELAMAQIGTKEKELELTDFQQRLDAGKKVSQAQVAIKLAETVQAPELAGSPFGLATEALSRAQAALKAGRFKEAKRAAKVAKKKAEAAYAVARPPYLKRKLADERRAMSETMRAEAAKIEGIKVRLETVGQSRRLILPLVGLFSGWSHVLRRKHLRQLNAIAGLLKKYPSYPALVNGYTSVRVPRDRRYALSLRRAQKVAAYFLTFGLPFSRFVLSGRGAERQKGGAGPDNRVEIVLLFQ